MIAKNDRLRIIQKQICKRYRSLLYYKQIG